MNFDDLEWLQQYGSVDLKSRINPDGSESPFAYAKVDKYFSIDGKVCLPVEAVQGSLTEYGEVEIYDRSGRRWGLLVLTSGYELDLSSISDHFYMAYVTEVPWMLYGAPYVMRYSYVILNASDLTDYVTNYLDGAPLWGGFVHLKNPSLLVVPYKGLPPKIVADKGLNLPTPYHAEHMYRSVVQPFAFERFQKLYHLLELRFDYDVVQRIKGLGADLKEIGVILGEYAHDDLTRLTSLVRRGIKDFASLEQKLNQVTHCSQCEIVSKKMFFDVSKQRNPLRDNKLEYETMMGLGGFSQTGAKSNKLVGGTGTVLQGKYEKLLIEVTAFWIYRVRSSIVHSRIGEYVMTTSDEHFVAEFAEPLLREVIVQSFQP